LGAFFAPKNMSKYVQVSIFGFFVGVLFGSLFHVGFWFSVFLIFLSGTIFFVSRLFSSQPVFLNVFLSLFALFFAFGVFRMEFSFSRENSILKNMFGEKVSIEGVIVEEPDVRENSVHVIMQIEGGEKVLLITKKYPEFEYGEKIIASGQLVKPKNFKEKNGREFDYVSYLEKGGIFSEMNFPYIEILSQEQGSPLFGYLFLIKRAFLSSISRILPEPHAGLLGGLLVGEKHSFGKDIEDDFRSAGVIHIIVLSGYNITLVASFFMSILAPFSAVLRAVFGVLSIFLFTIMVGSAAATVRAAFMAGLIVFARATGRTADVLHLLFVAAFLMVMINPHILLSDPSFQLSFLATLGLLLLGEKIFAKLSFMPKKFLLRETMSTTLATQIFVLPLLLYQTGNLSLVALPANLFILMAIPGAMFFGFLTGIVGFLSFGVASVFGAVAFVFLAYVLFAVHFFSHLPFATVLVPEFSALTLIFLYLLLFYFSHHFFAVHKTVKNSGDNKSDGGHNSGIFSEDMGTFTKIVTDTEKRKCPDD
jgi:competence protein ComEC